MDAVVDNDPADFIHRKIGVVNRISTYFSTDFLHNMLISSKSTELLRDRIKNSREVFCRGLFLSARWFVLSEAVRKGMQIVILPNREAAEYCAADLYHLVEGDRVFFLPESGKSVERSNYKSSLGVQRTSAIGKILSYGDSPVKPANDDPLFIVTYPEALSEEIPATQAIQDAVSGSRRDRKSPMRKS